MSRARRWLLGTCIALAVLLVLLATGGWWLLDTTAGLRFALDRGVAMTGGRLAYAGARGSLAGTTSIDGLRFRSADGTTVSVAHASLDLRPWALLGRELKVTRARIEGVDVDLPPPSAAGQSAALSLEPPLALDLNDVRILRIGVRRADKPVFAADSLALAGTWNSRALVVRTLDLRAPAGSATVAGTLAVAPGHAGHGTASFAWTHAGTRYAGALTSTSDGKTAHLHAALAAPFALQADIALALDAGRAWTATLVAPGFDARALPMLPSRLKTLAVDLHGAGNARGGALNGTVVANGTTLRLDPGRFALADGTLTLEPLRLRSPDIAGSASITGSVKLTATPIAFRLDANWRDVVLPAELAGQELGTRGQLALAGTTARFTAQGRLALGPPGRLADITVDLAGTPRSLQLHSLELVQQHGGLDMSGSIDLAPRVAWRLDARATRFDPGAFLAGWNGALDFQLASRGTITPAGLQATLRLDHASGTLRQRDIAGSMADLVITPDNMLQGSLLLVAGHSRVHVVGKHGPRTDAVIALDIASLGDWLPNASGSLVGNFTARGAWPKLAVAGTARGSHLRVGERVIDGLQLSAAIADITRPGGKLALELDGVRLGQLAFAKVVLDGQGTAAAHVLKLDARGARLDASLALHGSWNAGARRWSGSLQDTRLTPKGLSTWRQRQASAISWSRAGLALSEFCLAADGPSACVSANRSAKGALAAQFSLQRLPLQLLATLAPDTIPLQASGEVSGAGQLTLAADGTLGGNARLDTSAGAIAYASTADVPLLAWKHIGLTLTARGTHQQVQLAAALAQGGHVKGEATLEGSTHVLAGTLDADIRNLGFIEALSPELANVQGTLAGTLQLSGTLSVPRFQGAVTTRGFSAELPRAGLKLHDGHFALSGDAQGRLAITGQITSGGGVLHVTGNAGMGNTAPLSFAIKGDNVLVADIPAAHVVASPDLQVTRKDGVFALTGSVAIPNARVAMEKLPGQGPARASPDVVIVDAPPAPEVTPLAVTADIEVKLGDAVKVQGYGLDGTVHGQLAVRVRPGRTATGRGQISISGTYQAYGQDLTIDRGRLLFAGTRLDNPGLDIRAVRELRSQDVTVGLSIRGTAQQPILTVISDPAMEQAQALSYLVTGRPLDSLRSGDSDALNTAAQALGGLAGDRIAKSIGARLGIEAGVSTSEALGGSAFTAGKYLSPRLFLSYGVGLFTPGQVITLRYTLNRFLQFEAENASTGNRASLNYKIEK